MKLGAESRSKMVIGFALAVIAAFLAGQWSSSTRQLNTDLSVTVSAKTPAPNYLNFELLRLSEPAEYRGGRRNIFRKQQVTTQSRTPQPPPPPQPRHVTASPRIGLKFFGLATQAGDSVRVFLSEGGEVFIASEGEIVERRYRVVRVNPSSVEIEDVLTNHSENIPLTQG